MCYGVGISINTEATNFLHWPHLTSITMVGVDFGLPQVERLPEVLSNRLRDLGAPKLERVSLYSSSNLKSEHLARLNRVAVVVECDSMENRNDINSDNRLYG
jgi:hypothetical protein